MGSFFKPFLISENQGTATVRGFNYLSFCKPTAHCPNANHSPSLVIFLQRTHFPKNSISTKHPQTTQKVPKLPRVSPPFCFSVFQLEVSYQPPAFPVPLPSPAGRREKYVNIPNITNSRVWGKWQLRDGPKSWEFFYCWFDGYTLTKCEKNIFQTTPKTLTKSQST